MLIVPDYVCKVHKVVSACILIVLLVMHMCSMYYCFTLLHTRTVESQWYLLAIRGDQYYNL